MAQLKRGRFDDAKQTAEASLALSANAPAARNAAMLARFRQGDHDGARSEAHRLLRDLLGSTTEADFSVKAMAFGLATLLDELGDDAAAPALRQQYGLR